MNGDTQTSEGDETGATDRVSRRAFAGATAAAGLGAIGVATPALAGDERGDGGGDAGGDGRAGVAREKAEAATAEAAVCFADQTTDGGTVTVASATLPADGFVVVREACRPGGPTDRVIGVSAPLSAGTHESVAVDLFDVPGADFDRKRLAETGKLVATLHRDTDTNGRFEFVASGGTEDPAFGAGGVAGGTEFLSVPVTDAACVEVNDC